jgi:hypothetical protein
MAVADSPGPIRHSSVTAGVTTRNASIARRLVLRECAYCGDHLLTDLRSVYCCPACKQAAYRLRKRQIIKRQHCILCQQESYVDPGGDPQGRCLYSKWVPTDRPLPLPLPPVFARRACISVPVISLACHGFRAMDRDRWKTSHRGYRRQTRLLSVGNPTACGRAPLKGPACRHVALSRGERGVNADHSV